jgi:transposase
MRSFRDLKQREPSVEKLIRIGMDTSKRVFQLHGVNAAEQAVLKKKLRRKEMLEFFCETGADGDRD